jgi:KUP system potassium uptake protein
MQHNKAKFWQLVIGAIGIVYGDIGTSPLYAVKKCFGADALAPAELNVLGVISLIFWSLTIVVAIKYISLILRADNDGEGGILALSSLILRNHQDSKKSKLHYFIVFAGILGAAMLYGDGIITPAISVLGALEGLTIISPKFQESIVPLSVLILMILFLYQKRGTAKIGNLFGPVMIVWFLVIAILGLVQIIQVPGILLAINPVYALEIISHHDMQSIHILGGVVLTITGVEALYADLGHFNKKSMRSAWFYFVFPCLILNYFGQGALLLSNAAAVENPFYMLVPSWALWPTIVLATFATVIASQAVISGIFSITWQAVQLGYLPRMRVIHTSSKSLGQVYVPFINNFMLFLTSIAVIFFRSSENLASAYGITVTGIMVITTFLTIILSFYVWRWRLLKIIIVCAGLMLIDLLFFGVNLLKILEGGWFTILISLGIYVVMTTWRHGRKIALRLETRYRGDVNALIKQLKFGKQKRIPGTAIFLSRTPEVMPHALRIHLKYNKLLHEKVILLSVKTNEGIPRIAENNRLKIRSLGEKIYQITANYGFMEIPDISKVMENADKLKPGLGLLEAPFFISRGVPQASPAPYLKGFFEKLYVFLSHNSASTVDFFKLPQGQILEIGIRFKV